MDAHYDIVMKARQQAGEGSRFYFAYSTILDRAAFEEWRAQHAYEFFDLPEGRPGEAVELTLVYDFPSRWWGGRVAGLADEKNGVVHGLVFEIAEKDWAIIQHKEGAVTGMCIERQVQVKVAGGVVEATAFTTNPQRASSDGPVSDRFVEALTRGAQAAKLPAPWLEKVRALAK
ncbi:MAG: gamma-glutamylcyclotransferase [Archangium sp.]|nr:gamma-glutamylcyclotransferase [Archangium sp.]MDP3158315.1 gamma-glutamylcyclotransferase [Archangium sp.]MDP3569594.1 gamma-glutamylcyclotransferase [Archangium sp.]